MCTTANCSDRVGPLCEKKDARLLEGARIDGFVKRANGVDQTIRHAAQRRHER
jgi:hypothetical protein